jgi:hypothetical protein
MGVVLHSKTGLLHSVLKISAVDALRTHGPSILFRLDAVTSLVVFLMLAAWALFNWRRLGHAEWIPLSAGLCCFLLSLILFPTQYNYMDLLAFLVPCSLLIASRTSSKLAFPGIALLLFSVFSVNLFVFSFNLLARFEQRASYQAASRQPAYLLSQLSSPDAVVGFSGDYDLFKPYFHHLIDIQPLGDGGTKVDTSSMAAVANCYSSFVGGPGEVRPLQGKLSSSEFHLIQPAPEHMWITLFGHRITNTQRSLSCDLYLRNSPATGAKAPRH